MSTINSRCADAERTVLEVYFGLKARKANALERAYAVLGVEGEDDGLCTRLDAAVANIVLHRLQRELPQWAALRDGDAVFGRDVRRKRVCTKVKRSTHLFTINWADSGPGFSWPMAYYSTEVPAYGHVVVTASADSSEMVGFCDVAVGHFPVSTDPLAQVRKIIIAHWTKLRDDGQSRWVYLFDEVLIDGQLANEWADEVWSDESDEGWT